jgi:molybdenum cofactor cytidylyltransferase
MIAGVVLAAGRSRRMGEPKPLLRWEGESFLARVVRVLRQGGCAEVVVVTGPEGEAVPRRIAAEARAAGARTAVNPLPGSEPIHSLRAGLAVLPGEAEAAVVSPADMPGIDAETVRALVAAFRRGGAPIVLPVREGRHGHPGLFSRAVWPELLSDPLPRGAHTVIDAHARSPLAELEEVPVENPLAFRDVNTPDDYRRLREGADERP